MAFREGSQTFKDVPSDARGVLDVFGREILPLSARQRKRRVEKAVAYWRERGFPYATLAESEKLHDFRQLERVKIGDVIRGSSILPSTLGLRLANVFHPQIWDVPSRRHLKSPMDHFDDDDTLSKLLDRAVQFWPNRRCWNAQCVRGLLRIYSGGRVSNFRPAAARALISRYSRAGNTVVDFSAGFGGRLLGCLTLERNYIGIDSSPAQISGLTRMIETLSGHAPGCATLICDRAEKALPRFRRESADLVFSSPPYFDVERYGSDDSQSYFCYRKYQEWKELFLNPVISASYEVLKRGGHLVLNVADTQRHAIAKDIEAITSHLFRERKILRLLMHSRPLQRSVGAKPYRWEPVFVFRKPD